MNTSATRRYNKLCLTTLVAVYFLVLVGGIVRSTGSGMGCPDWPRCFGSWVPPTSVNELPDNYKEQYVAFREKKNQKFARYLTLIGLDDTSRKILNDPSVRIETDFNPVKTWVEYVNRLVGVAIGLLIIALFVVSWRTRKIDPPLFYGSLGVLILVIFQGWFGSIVVSTNLTAWTVTVHMFLALLMVVILVWLMVRSSENRLKAIPGVGTWLIVGMVVLLVQIFLGTQVRERLDLLAVTLARESWVGNAGLSFLIHRSFSWVVVAVQLAIWFKVRKTSHEKSLTVIPFLLVLLSVLTGTGMAYFGVPPTLQPIHLLLAVITFGWFAQLYWEMSSPAFIKEKELT